MGDCVETRSGCIDCDYHARLAKLDSDLCSNASPFHGVRVYRVLRSRSLYL